MTSDLGSHGDDAHSQGLSDLSPAYFGMVMATGIVSLAAWQSGLLPLRQMST